MKKVPERSQAGMVVGPPAQAVRRFAEQWLSDDAEIDDLVEEILGACVSEFPGRPPLLPGEQWVMRVAARVVSERWRRCGPPMLAAS